MCYDDGNTTRSTAMVHQNAHVATVVATYVEAQKQLHITCSNLGPNSIHAALEQQGYTGSEMRPSVTEYVGQNAAGQYMYDCTWQDGEHKPAGRTHGRLFVWVHEGKLIADW